MYKNLLKVFIIQFYIKVLYSIIIEKDYDIYNLNKNDICLVKSNVIKKSWI